MATLSQKYKRKFPLLSHPPELPLFIHLPYRAYYLYCLSGKLSLLRYEQAVRLHYVTASSCQMCLRNARSTHPFLSPRICVDTQVRQGKDRSLASKPVDNSVRSLYICRISVSYHRQQVNCSSHIYLWYTTKLFCFQINK